MVAKKTARQAKPARASEAKAAPVAPEAGQPKDPTQRQAVARQDAEPVGDPEGLDPVDRLFLRVKDQGYQRDAMVKPMTKALALLEELADLEKDRPLRLHGEGPTFSELAILVRDRLEGIRGAKLEDPAARGPHADLVRDLEYDTNERLYGAREADEFNTPERYKAPAEQEDLGRKTRRETLLKAHHEVLRKSRAERSKAMIEQVRREIEKQLQGAPNESWRRNLEGALAETLACDTSRKGMEALVLSLETRRLGKLVAVIDLGRYTRAIGYARPPGEEQK